jgi:hypothetical protein
MNMVDRDWNEFSGFADIELAHAGVQGTAVETEELGRAVPAADFPLNLFQHSSDKFTFHIGLCLFTMQDVVFIMPCVRGA